MGPKKGKFGHKNRVKKQCNLNKSAITYIYDYVRFNFYVKLATLKTTSQTELFGANVVKTLEQDKWHGGKASGDEKAAIDTIKTELETIAKDVLNYLQ